MEHSELEITLKLSSLNARETQNANLDNDNWLDNDDATLLTGLDNESATSDTRAIDEVMQEISRTYQSRIFNVSELQIKQNPKGFAIFHNDTWHALNNHDLIKISDTCLEAAILQKEIITEAPQTDPFDIETMGISDDIWQLPDTPAAAPISNPGLTANPLNHSGGLLSQSTGFEDPLDFLYGQQNHNHYQNLLGGNAESDIYQAQMRSVDSSLSLMSPNQISSYGNDNSLIPSDHYTPTSTPQAAVSRDQLVLHQDNHAEGNVLKDLGMNEQSAGFHQLNPTHEQPNFNQQSPMDMVDELLYDDSSDQAFQAAPAYQAHMPAAPQPVYQAAAPLTANNISKKPSGIGGFFKKVTDTLIN